MPTILKCPSCSSKLKVPDGTKKLRCPKCKHVFELGSASSSSSKRHVKGMPVQATSSAQGKTQVCPASKPRESSRPQNARKTLRCRDCQATLKIPASALGKRVRCPKCSNTFTAAAAVKEHSAAPVQASLQAIEPMGGDDLFGSLPSGSVSQKPELERSGLAPANPDHYRPAASYSGDFQPCAPPPAPRKKKARRSTGGWQSWLTEPQQLFMLAGIVALASFVLSAIPFVGIGVFLVVLVSYIGIQTAGGIWLVVIAFQEEVVQGILYLFVPFYALIYLITRWDTCRVPFMMCMVSLLSVVSSLLGTIVGTTILGLMVGP